ncbi:PREDICTED: PR domain zinc finger protein 8 [Hipposideros armiger]|uniref:PR domain zinc finger protein 8 n=1 Tax=Hipposideros armiger TaxID=186990 RepID=A0A8B7Q2I2_HIPAR|nr:PREDICTED: PR domain zinc finger protein 8 [Hipposideros armiger]XP_019482964.1 PREDICTED: PR domain zinc finger protein 8 [Hipposideros armiger]XP_019482966.1 PREDICTED: PR domain zinc finger protein 8 [Hipposideros armiger]XP_019482967.1 PREDICTED: PR domain zinc finger protein 8 [Hipposideros armiger]XP_019482968.1 PREDICTED: PR domain zinc finger protein 8 [Hipposideros armiger]XP_019482969.1 PREDICTED: PR domain zinc finger protein 8 [Hipposideros armiger]
MEDSGIQRGIWDGDAKAVQQCLTDIFTSVYTTCDIPENAIFGPCVLSHTSLYDSIAFIALKSTDKRTVPYIFRVDTSAANGSSEGLMWLRLVQSARDKEEQNLEAYIKNGQLFYRSLRRIAKDEELLVWYGKELTELLLLCPSRPHSKMNGSSPYTCLECSQRFQFEFPYVAHLRFRCPKRLHSADRSPQDQQGGGVGTKDHGGGGCGKDQQQQQEAPLGPGPKFCKAGPIHHYPTPSPEGSNPPVAGGGSSAKPSTDFHNLARELENSGGGSSCSPGRSLSSGSGGGGHQEAELSPDGNAAGLGKGKRKFPEEAAEGGGAGLLGGRGRFPERPVPTSKEDLVCTPQQYRASGSYFGLEENGRLFAPPSPETGEAKRSAFVEVKKAARAAGLQEEAAADGGGTAAEDQDAGGGGGSSTPVAASPAAAEKLLAPRPGGPLPSRLEGGSPARGSAFTSVPQLGGAGGGQGAASDERKSAFSQPARSFSQLSPLVLGQKLSALEPCHPGDGVGPARLYPSATDPLAVKLQGAADLNGGCGALPSSGGGLPKQSPFLYATAFWPKSSAAAAAAAAAAAGPLQLQLPSALTLLPPSFTSLCLPAQNWCAKCNASFRMTSDLVYHMRSHHKKEYAMEPLVKRRREEKLKCPICNESFRERHHLSRHMTSHN